MKFGKPPLSYADQADLLFARGLIVGNRDVLLRQYRVQDQKLS